MSEKPVTRCCCGRFKESNTLPSVLNEITHEEWNIEGSFCGPTVNHLLKDANKKIAILEKERKAAVEKAVKKTLETVNERIEGMIKPLNSIMVKDAFSGSPGNIRLDDESRGKVEALEEISGWLRSDKIIEALKQAKEGRG